MCDTVYDQNYAIKLPKKKFGDYELNAYTDDERLPMSFPLETQRMIQDTLAKEMEGRRMWKEWLSDSWLYE